jgi:hypothetical protein
MTLLQRFWRWLLALFQPDGRRRETDGLPGDKRQQTDAYPTPRDPLPAPPVVAVPVPPAVAPGDDSSSGRLPAVGGHLLFTFDLPISDDAQFSVWASLLTQREQVTYRTLLHAFAGRYQVMAKVRLWDFIHLDNEPAQAREYRTRLSCRHVDFLLCEPSTLRPRLGIELDDHSHRSVKGQADDRFKNDLFAAAGLPLLRLDQPNYTARVLREMVAPSR